MTALPEIERLQPTIALLGLELPDLLVTEVIRRVREQNLPTRCAIVGTRKDPKTVREVLRAGAYGYLLKTSSYKQMANALVQFTKGEGYVSPQIEATSLLDEKSHRRVDPIELLSSREFQVFSMLVDGVRAKEIAARLSLSPKTVDTFRSSLMRKLDIHDVPGLVKFAVSRGLTELHAA
jgi:DNA-binding NarL/FixJ family response regulator